MIRQFSAGGIVFNSKGEVILVRNYKPEKDVNYWGFPKGHLEQGESSEQAALREVEEETGVKAEIIKKVGKIEYFFVINKERIFKTVTMFAMRYLGGDVKHQERELAEAKWFDPEEALETISFDNDKSIFNKALEAIKENPQQKLL